MFKRVIGKKCAMPGFKSCDVIVDTSLGACPSCNGPLILSTSVDKRAVSLAGFIAVLLVGATGYLVTLAISYSPERITESGEQRKQSANESSKAVLQGEVEKELRKLLRLVYSDQVKTSEEQLKIDSLARRHSITPKRLADEEQETRDRLARSQASLKQAMLYASREEYGPAVKELRDCIGVDPDNAFAWANLAAVYLSQGEREQAHEACRKAIALDSRNWLAHYNLGSLYASREDKDLAIHELSEALRLVNEDQTQRITKAEVTDLMRSDQALGSLLTDPRFRQLLARN